MGTDATRSRYSVLGVSDPRLTLDTSESTLTQAGPRPGVPEPQADGIQLVLQSSGSQSADSTVELLCQRGGFAEPDGAGFVWRQSGDTDYRGWDTPNAITSYFQINVGGTVNRPHAITLRYQDDSANNDTVLVAASGTGDVTIWRRTASEFSDTDLWDNITVTIENGGSDYHFPCLVELPTGRILLFTTGAADGSDTNIEVRFSDDQGATWTLGRRGVLETAIDTGTYGIKRVRAAYAAGQISLIVWINRTIAVTVNERLMQYASADSGFRFELVQELDASTVDQSGCAPDIVGLQSGGFIVTYGQFSSVSATSQIQQVVRRLGSAYEPLTSGDRTVNGLFGTPHSQASGGDAPDQIDSALAQDEDGTLWLYVWRSTGGVANEGYSAAVSLDAGLNWNAVGSNLNDSSEGSIWNDSTGDATPARTCLVAQRGRLLWFGNYYDGTPTLQEDLVLIVMGGYSTVTMPQLDVYSSIKRQVGWDVNWLPFDLPSAMGWTLSGSPTTNTITGGYLDFDTSGGSAGYEKTGIGGTLAEGIIAYFDAECESGTAVIVVRLADNAGTEYDLQLQLTSSALTAVDASTSGTLATTVSPSGRTQILVHMYESGGTGYVTIYWRSADTDEDREWSTLYSSTISDGGHSTTTKMRFGAGNTAETRYYSVCYVSDEYTGQGPHAEDITNPDDLFTRSFSGAPVYVDDGVRITASGGPAVTDDEWHVATRYDYSIAHVLESQPRLTWRSTSTAETTLTYTLGAEGDTSTGNDGIIIALCNTNVHTMTLYGYDDDTSTYDNLGTLTTSEGMESLKWVRQGSGITYGSSPAGDTPYFYLNELAGATWSVGFGGFSYRITHNSEGRWDDSTTAKRPYIFLQDLEAGKGASGTGGLVLPKNVAFYVPLDGAKYSKFRLVIDDPTGNTTQPAEDYWEIGTLIIGPAVVLGYEYGWGRTLDLERASQLVESEDGTVSARTLAPSRRVIEVDWTDGVDMSEAMSPDGDFDPPYVDISQDTGHEPVGSEDTPYQLLGLLDLLEGPKKPLVYLPRVAQSNSIQTFNRYHELMLCRLDGGVSVETVLGNELEDEVVRVPVLRLREEV